MDLWRVTAGRPSPSRRPLMKSAPPISHGHAGLIGAILTSELSLLGRREYQPRRSPVSTGGRSALARHHPCRSPRQGHSWKGHQRPVVANRGLGRHKRVSRRQALGILGKSKDRSCNAPPKNTSREPGCKHHCLPLSRGDDVDQHEVMSRERHEAHDLLP